MKIDMESLGNSGRAIYRNFMMLGIFFQPFMEFFFAGLIVRVTGKAQNLLRLLFFIPLLTAILDYFENGLLFLALVDYPLISTPLALAASLATQFKMIFNMALLVSLVVTLITWITHRSK